MDTAMGMVTDWGEKKIQVESKKIQVAKGERETESKQPTKKHFTTDLPAMPYGM